MERDVILREADKRAREAEERAKNEEARVRGACRKPDETEKRL